jgi:hypothetical protein
MPITLLLLAGLVAEALLIQQKKAVAAVAQVDIEHLLSLFLLASLTL